MTDRETLFRYRLRQAEETISDAEAMLHYNLTNKSIINRAYYSAFYIVLTLFLKFEIPLKTSKHSGIISIFDREFVHSGRIDKKYSKILHRLFDARQEGDYKELSVFSQEETVKYVDEAKELVTYIKKLF